MDQAFRAGDVEVRPIEREVRIEGSAVPVGARAFDVLLALLRHRDRVVTKGELLDMVWPDTVVEENNLQSQVSQLRKVLGAKAIATIPGRGYRLAIAFEQDGSAAGRPDAAVTDADAGPALIGRAAELEAVACLLAAHRLVTIVGTGGMGKTSLASQVARATGGSAHWVDLAALVEAEKIAPAIANAAGLPLGEGPAAPLLVRAIGVREIFLVLDNCEHLAKHVALLAHALLRDAPGVRILATSQEPLHVAGEHVFRLGALPVPPPGSSLQVARAHASIQLLEQRAQAAGGRFVLREDSLAGAIELCRRLDGIPLAIEMAAARLPVLGADALLERLDERMRLLKSGLREAPARQQTLQATIDWSHSLLSDAEKIAFRRLGAFVGTFRLEVAQKVTGWGALDEWSALDALMGLADKSLLQVDGDEVPRYRLLESARLHALGELARHGEADEAMQRHGEAMAWLAEAGSNAYWKMTESPTPAAWYPDYDDFHAAFDRAAERGDPAVMGGVSRLLSILDFERNVYSTVRRRKEAAWRALDGAPPLHRARLLQVVCLFRLILLPDVPRVRAAEERVRAWRDLGDVRMTYFALSRLAADYAMEGRGDESAAALGEARALDDPAWTPHWRWFLHFAARNAALYGSDTAEMVRTAREMLEIAERARWTPRIAESRVACAEAELAAGGPAEAATLANLAAEACRKLDQPLNLFESLTVLCAAQIRLGAVEDARATALLAIDLPWQLEVSIAFFDQLAHLAALRGRMESAAMLFGFADRGYEATQDRRHTHGAYAEAEGASRVEAALGPREHRRLRSEGAALSETRAELIARDCLAEKTE